MVGRVLRISGALALSFIIVAGYSYIAGRFVASGIPKKKTPPAVLSASDDVTLPGDIGELFMFGVTGPQISSDTARLLAAFRPAGVLILGTYTQSTLASMTAQLRHAARNWSPVIAIDQEGGTVRRLSDDPNPGARALAQSAPGQLCSAWSTTSAALAKTGVTLNFGLVADVCDRTSYLDSRCADKTAAGMTSYVKTVLSCADLSKLAVKHFPGYGNTKRNPHVSVPILTVSGSEWKELYEPPFREAVDEGIPAVMMAHVNYPKIATEPASLSSVWYRTLRETEGFSGVIVTDDLNMLRQAGYDLTRVSLSALDAGADLLLFGDIPDEAENIRTIIASKSADTVYGDMIRAKIRRVRKLPR